MQPLPTGSRRSTRLALVAGGLVVLLGVVSFASRSGFGHAGKAAPSNAYVSYAFTAFLILFVAMIPVTVYAWIQRARELDPSDRDSGWRRFVRNMVTIAMFVAAAYVIYVVRTHFHLPHHAATGKVPPPGTKHGPGKNRIATAAQEQSPTFEWTVLWIALGLLAVGMVSAVYVWRRFRLQLGPLQDVPDLSQDVVETIGDAIGDLEREPDPRRAVIAAYARMERVLGRHGLERRRSETAVEYMRRVLLGLTERGAAVQRLTALFERAKFSRHEIDASMKAEAIGALQEIREGMA